MAATRLIALHKNKGKSVAACLKSRTDYVQNPDKTQQGELVSSYECSPLTVDEEFMLSKRQYELVTGRRQKSDVIAYQIRQSFKPGEITAEEANKVGYELAMRFTKGKYQRDIKPVPALSCGGVFRYRSGERLHGMQEVSGSIPLFSTKKKDTAQFVQCLSFCTFVSPA